MGLAEESPKTKRAREKLRRHLDAIDRKITPQALAQKTLEIQKWIARHAPSRVVLKDKSIKLFDQNQNAAQISRKVSAIAEALRKEMQNVTKK